MASLPQYKTAKKSDLILKIRETISEGQSDLQKFSNFFEYANEQILKLGLADLRDSDQDVTS